MVPTMKTAALCSTLALALAAGCVPGGDDHGGETEIISRVELRFTPVGGGETLVFAFSDPDGDGGLSGTAEPVELALGVDYELEVAFVNDLVDPPEDISDEIAAEAEEHFVFIYGEGVSGPASSANAALLSHAYADLESDYGPNAVGEDLPLGLRNTITAGDPGTSTLRVMLRHLPELNGSPQKRGDLPAALAAGEALPGDVDADLSFALKVE